MIEGLRHETIWSSSEKELINTMETIQEELRFREESFLMEVRKKIPSTKVKQHPQTGSYNKVTFEELKQLRL